MVAILDKPTGICVMPILKKVMLVDVGREYCNAVFDACLAAHFSDTVYLR